jgi:hypothetical protein
MFVNEMTRELLRSGMITKPGVEEVNRTGIFCVTATFGVVISESVVQ